jgi:hypothetical protein
VRSRRLRTAAVLLAALSLGSPARAAALFAERLTPENADRLRVGGPDAVGGVGDWALGNGVLCAVVSDALHESPISVSGGGLVDLGHCGRADDQWSVGLAMRNLGRENVPDVDAIRTEVEGGEARVVVTSRSDGVELERSFALGEAEPEVLLIRTRAERVAEGAAFSALGDLVLHPSGALRVFAASSRDPAASPGFRHPDVSGRSWLAVADSFGPIDLQVLVGDEAIGPGIAYGLELRGARRVGADGRTAELPFLATTGQDFTLSAVLVRPFWVGGERGIGLLQLAQMRFMDLAVGERIEVLRAVRVGARADVASVTDGRHPDAPRVVGRVDDPEAWIEVETAAGVPFGGVRPGADGSFAFRAPPGRYRLHARASGGRTAARDVEVGAGGGQAGSLAVGAPARVRLPRGEAMRLVFRGVDGTPDPVFEGDLAGYAFGGAPAASSLAAGDVSLAGVASDPLAVRIAPGRYRVLATRGPEFELGEVRLEVPPGAEVELEIAPPRRAFATAGWIAADLHVHGGGSFDSALPAESRVRSFLAQGAEVLVSTEHDRIVDLAPLLARMGVAERMRSVVGVELTPSAHTEAVPHSFGHANAFPLVFEPLAYRGGAPRVNGRRLREAIAELRADGTGRLIQVNHPRSEDGAYDEEGLFTHLSVAGEPFEPGRPLEAAPNRALLDRDPGSGVRDLDFDALEVWNGPQTDAYRRARADWFSLLLQGELRTATANSDSHGLGRVVALPRNWVRVPDDRVEAFDRDAFVAALRAGRAQGSTGPFLEVRLGGAEIGGTFRGHAAALSVTARAASWVPVERLRVWVDAQVVAERPLARGETVVLPLRFETDAFLVVEVEGEAGPEFRSVAPGVPPFAFANPIYVDADEDGHWRAPGWPARVPPVLIDPLRVGPEPVR